MIRVIIWIVSRDIAFSYELKEKILGSPVTKPFRKGLKVEVFQSISVLNPSTEKTPRSASTPSFLILDPFPEWENALGIYLKLLRAGSPVVRNVLFCSSLSYGLFGDFFLRGGIDPPPFVLKSEMTKKLDGFLISLFAGETPPSPAIPALPSLSPLVGRRVMEELKQAVSRLEERYYGEGPLSQGLSELIGELEKIRGLLTKAGFDPNKGPLWGKLSGETDGLLTFLSGGKQVTPVRIKRKLKEYLSFCSPFLK